jgi:hypothetical protein
MRKANLHDTEAVPYGSRKFKPATLTSPKLLVRERYMTEMTGELRK